MIAIIHAVASRPSIRQELAFVAALSVTDAFGSSDVSTTTRSSLNSGSWKSSGTGRLSSAAMTMPMS